MAWIIGAVSILAGALLVNIIGLYLSFRANRLPEAYDPPAWMMWETERVDNLAAALAELSATKDPDTINHLLSQIEAKVENS